MSDPFVLAGGAAFSPFRLEALAARVGARIEATWIYLLDLASPLDPESESRARTLLEAPDSGSDPASSAPGPAGGFFVTPRKGTVSPWSSKATDIFRNCGLVAVRRVERGIRFRVRGADGRALGPSDLPRAAIECLHDRMTECVLTEIGGFFDRRPPAPGRTFDVLLRGPDALAEANRALGLALSGDEVSYLADAYARLGRNPTDTELVMFGQVNSEHCRHKVFNASWVVDGAPQDRTLFGMIRHTHAIRPEGTLVAYKDNSSVIEGFRAPAFTPDPAGHAYAFADDQVDVLMKVETHNHPTAISPFPGAATGVGGEIRDEAATGIGSRSKAGIAGFAVSNLRVPGFAQPWERDAPAHPRRLATPLAIMLEGPIGGAAFGNEFGRPQLAGFFRTYEEEVSGRRRGYHKPIMLAGGMGNIRRSQVYKKDLVPGAWVVQIGGPAMRIGLGGGAASSMASGSNDSALDFDSVQRGNAEMERRCQEVIDGCVALGADNPILSIHDVGAGGLSNACPELVERTGAVFGLRDVPNDEPSMSPMEVWCCEAQERYVLAIGEADRERFEALCRRERCPVAFIGRATGDGRLVLADPLFGDRPIDVPLDVLLGKPPRMLRDVARDPTRPPPLDLSGVAPREALARVLALPAVADKTFLVTIADRSVGGMVHRDQMVGPWQVPLADCAVTVTGYRSVTGEAMAVGERTPVAVVDGPASGRMAVGEALTNLAGAGIGAIGGVKLSANWMCACGEPGEDARLFDTVAAVALDLCPRLGVSIPVGKDSLSMRTVWDDPATGEPLRQTAPLGLIVSAFATVPDVRRAVTPDLAPGPSSLVLVDLGAGRDRLGGSALAQVFNQAGDEPPDLDDPEAFGRFFAAVAEMVGRGLLLAYHDRSDGGAAVTLCEMAVAGGRGIDADLAGDPAAPLAPLFAEELGAVLQVAPSRLDEVRAVLAGHGLSDLARVVGSCRDDKRIRIAVGGAIAIDADVTEVRRTWSALTHRMQTIRDNPAVAAQEYEDALDAGDPGRSYLVTYDPEALPPPAPSAGGVDAAAGRPGMKGTGAGGERARAPRVAILREQGVNGHVEMAAAFALAGFESVDVHMTDLLPGRADLADFAGLVACGGFSYGDVLGAGSGWARSILYNDRLRTMFAAFFARPDTFTLGVCNGCQMVSQLKGIIPGAAHWPAFRRNDSEQFEARYATVEVLPSPSVLLAGMAGSRVPIPVAHGEGLAVFDSAADRDAAVSEGLAAVRYVDHRGRPTERYPLNPNGSEGGLTGFTSVDGRALILMPHPERAFRSVQLSWRPAGTFEAEAGPWMRMFRNAYAFATRG
ncbi:MAG: phosphoribosylformylglycinamidine synthase [Deltaproteobacteria bacterium]|nr:phosphoribosylformylglycinamidine synthase [Deltaproteobacteria bacterium]